MANEQQSFHGFPLSFLAHLPERRADRFQRYDTACHSSCQVFEGGMALHVAFALYIFSYFRPTIMAESPNIIIAPRRLEPKMDLTVST